VTKARPSLGRRRRGIKTADEIREIVARVADLAGVVNPNDRRGRYLSMSFYEEVGLAIRLHQGIDPRKGNAFLKAELAFRTAKEAILALDKRDQAKLRLAFIKHLNEDVIPPSWRPRFELLAGKRIWNRALDDLLWTFSELTGNNPFPAPSYGRGRPRGTVKNWQLQKLIVMLWQMAKDHGGNLYADHKRDDGGTMIKALELLRPVLPESLLPKILSAPTIETIIKNLKASGRDW